MGKMLKNKRHKKHIGYISSRGIAMDHDKGGETEPTSDF